MLGPSRPRFARAFTRALRALGASAIGAIALGACGETVAPPEPPTSPSEDAGTSEAAAGCPTVVASERGTIGDPSLFEASGLTASRLASDVLWSHNDSGDEAYLFALRTDGTAIAKLLVTGAQNVDWEAIAAAPANGVPSLYIGDIGDNDLERANVTIYVVPEPAIDPAPAKVAVAERIDLRYDDGPHDAETLLVDPTDGTIVVVTKRFDGSSGIYVANRTTGILEHRGTLSLATAPLSGLLATDGAVSPDGSRLIVRTYGPAFMWRRSPGQSLVEALGGVPCPLPTSDETQGEAVAFAADGRGYFTVSERLRQPLWYYALTP